MSISSQLFCFIILICFPISTISYRTDSNNKRNGQLVELENGLIQGKLEKVLDTHVESYLGIPYAKPPLNELRFRKPQPFNSNYSNDVYNATYFRSACMQKYGDEAIENLGGVDFSEDCLHINIWVPHDKFVHSPLKPVLFYIFASSFRQSSPAKPSNGGQFLSAVGDIIVVEPNYRIGFLGFACCGENFDDMPGNLGFHDIIMALKWVRNNIRSFGGDPEAITISGASAGAMLAMMLAQTPEVPQSWFNNIFIMSGIPANGVLDSIDVGIEKTQFILKQVGCSNSIGNYSHSFLTEDEIECLRSANLTAILELQDAEQTVLIGASIKHGMIPVYGDQLLPESPELSLSSKKFPPSHKSFVIGNVQQETSWETDYWPVNKSEAIDFLMTRLKSMLKTNNRQTLDKLKKMIYNYLGDVDENDRFKIRGAMNRFCSDWSMKCPSLYFAEKLAIKKNIVHLYIFNYVSKVYTRADGTSERPFGSRHGDDTLLIFGQPFRDPYNYNHQDRLMSKKLMKLYTDFVKNRRLPWPPVLTDGKRVEPLYWKISGSLDSMDIDVVRMTKQCEELNELRNHEFYDNQSVDSFEDGYRWKKK
ncbi:acetylcholinesterase-1-like [Tetranychus urticae]|uniref:Carboxylic ester hydrolase n=1 Tax=Tetranychus urticae TaxID=32264 RepID=T1L405_TETUR|nr:acetylcholinesterase-1-like [Tetranychus urticae]